VVPGVAGAGAGAGAAKAKVALEELPVPDVVDGSIAPVKVTSSAGAADAEVAALVEPQPIRSRNSQAAPNNWRSCSVRKVRPHSRVAAVVLVKLASDSPRSPVVAVAGVAAAVVEAVARPR